MPAGRPKGSSGTNKSAIIREYFKANPSANTNEVIEALAKKGIEVSPALVGGVRVREQRGPGNKSRGAITVDELTSIHTIIEKFDDRSVIMGIIEDLSGLIKNLGGIARFDEAMKAYESWKPSDAVLESSETSSSDDDDEDEEEEEEDEDED